MEKPFRTEYRKGLTKFYTASADFTENQADESGIKKGKRITVYGGITNTAILARCCKII